MKILTTISILIMAFSAIGQKHTNQMTAQGQKTGKWIQYYSNGEIYKVRYFEPANRKISKKEAISYGVTDSIIYFESLKWREEYEYNADWKLKRKKRDEPYLGIFYLYGANNEIKLEVSDFSFLERVGNTKSVSVELTNNTDYAISLVSEISSSNITTESHKFELDSNSSSTFTFMVVIEPSDNSYILTLKNDSITIDFSIQAFGYHIESDDIEKGQKLISTKKFVYYRTRDEALLKFYDLDKKKVLETVSLEKQQTIVDLKRIKPGHYWLSIVDYSADEQFFCKIIIKK